MPKKLRIFLGLSEIAGVYHGLEAGFKQLNVKVTRFELTNHPFKYNQQSSQPFLVKQFQQSMIRSKTGTVFKKLYWKLISIIYRLILFLSVFFTHDIFIFSYGASFFRLKDLKLFKLFGKKIIFQFHGSDSRPPFMDGVIIPYYDIATITKMTAKKKRQLKKINRYADAIIDIPPMGLFHEKPFINWLRVGFTVSITQAPNITKIKNNSIIKILHAPSNPLGKGTEIIEQCVDQLKLDGYAIELIKIHNQPNHKVKEALAECDFVIDQLFADYPMPGFATESAWYSKPTIICGYAVELWNSLLPQEHMPPTYYCHPNELMDAIKLFCDDPDVKFSLGQKAFNFVNQKWSPIEVAKRYLQIIENNIPESWICYPNQISYVHGCCIHENVLQNFLKKFLSRQDLSVLQLQDKPDLAQKFLKFANGVN